MHRNVQKEQSVSTISSPAKRGRPKKRGKLKVSRQVVATGRGRGRPKTLPRAGNDDEAGESEGNEDETSPSRKIKIVPKRGRGGGRPRKVVNNGSESDGGSSSVVDDLDDYDERRPVGRPPTGAVNLNIVRTGRGQGRPKKVTIEKRKAAIATGNDGEPKKRGRPSLGKSQQYVSTGRARGRPKSTAVESEKQQSDDDFADADKTTECILPDRVTKQLSAREDDIIGDNSGPEKEEKNQVTSDSQ